MQALEPAVERTLASYPAIVLEQASVASAGSAPAFPSEPVHLLGAGESSLDATPARIVDRSLQPVDRLP